MKLVDIKIDHFDGRNRCQMTFSLFTIGIKWLSISYLKPKIKKKIHKIKFCITIEYLKYLGTEKLSFWKRIKLYF